MYRIEELITIASEKGASDVHLIAGLPPKCRIDGLITNLTEETLTHEDCEEYGRQLAGEDVSEILHRGQLDLSAAIAGRRIRINLFRQQGSLSAALRLLSSSIPQLDDLGLPPAVRQFSRWNKGIVLVTGETGSHDAGSDPGGDQPEAAASYYYAGGSHRICLHAEARDHQPAGGRHRCGGL